MIGAMSFTVSDFQDLLALLREREDWREALRRELLGDDFRTLPQVMRELVASQAGTDASLDRLTEQVSRQGAQLASLTEQVSRQGAQLARLTEQVAELTVQGARHDERLAELTEQMTRLTGQVRRHDGRLGNLEGMAYEQRYRDNVGSRLGRRLRRARLVSLGDLEPLLDAHDDGRISDEEYDRVAALDLLVRGRAGRGADAAELYVAMELSITVDEGDVRRARERADLLRRVGLPVEAYVGGRDITPEAAELATSLGVTVLLDRASEQPAA